LVFRWPLAGALAARAAIANGSDRRKHRQRLTTLLTFHPQASGSSSSGAGEHRRAGGSGRCPSTRGVDASYPMLVPDRLRHGQWHDQTTLGRCRPHLAPLARSSSPCLPSCRETVGSLAPVVAWAMARHSSLRSMPPLSSYARLCCRSFRPVPPTAAIVSASAGSSERVGDSAGAR